MKSFHLSLVNGNIEFAKELFRKSYHKLHIDDVFTEKLKPDYDNEVV